jgi:hypothetical protein
MRGVTSDQGSPNTAGPVAPHAPVPTVGTAVEAELGELSAAVTSDETLAAKRAGTTSLRIGPIHVAWIVGALVVLLIAALSIVIWMRSKELADQEKSRGSQEPTSWAVPTRVGETV